MTQQSLWDLQSGETRRLGTFDERLDPAYKQRLLELGFQPGVAVTCDRRPPFGAPRLYRIEASVFSLEDAVARCVLLAPAAERDAAARHHHGAVR
jgi:Fe2+ transport system protein FeoA